MIRLLNGAFVAVHAAALLFFFVLGLAAAGSAHSNAGGEPTFFRPGPQRELLDAIQRNDVAAVAARAQPGADPHHGRSRTGQTLRHVVEEAARQRQPHHADGGRPSGDEGWQDALTRLKGV